MKTKLQIKMMSAKETLRNTLYKYAFVLPLLVIMYFVIHPDADGFSLTQEQQTQLKSWEGKYSAKSKDGEFFLQITAKGSSLILKQLWDNVEIEFTQQSELEFKAKDKDFPIKFIKGKNGEIVQMLAFNRDLWNKVAAAPKEEIVFFLTQQQLNALAGYYQYRDRKEAFVQCVVQGNTLVGIQLWDNKEFVFNAISDLEFISKEGIALKFIKKAGGTVTEVLVANMEWLDKVKEYTPIEKKEVQLTAQQLKNVEGFYFQQENRDLCMHITTRNNEIMVKQLWNNLEQSFVPVAELEFFSRGSMLTFKFTKGSNGQITQLTARYGKLWDKGPKPEEKQVVTLTTEDLKAFEGKYSLRYNGDIVYMQITSSENGLLLKQLWDGKEISFFPTSNLEFYNIEKAFPLKFIEKNGSIAQVEAFHKDLWSKVN